MSRKMEQYLILVVVAMIVITLSGFGYAREMPTPHVGGYQQFSGGMRPQQGYQNPQMQYQHRQMYDTQMRYQQQFRPVQPYPRQMYIVRGANGQTDNKESSNGSSVLQSIIQGLSSSGSQRMQVPQIIQQAYAPPPPPPVIIYQTPQEPVYTPPVQAYRPSTTTQQQPAPQQHVVKEDPPTMVVGSLPGIPPIDDDVLSPAHIAHLQMQEVPKVEEPRHPSRDQMSEETKQLQTELKESGYYYGQIDGVMTPELMKAIIAYHRNEYVPSTPDRAPATVTPSPLPKMELKQPKEEDVKPEKPSHQDDGALLHPEEHQPQDSNEPPAPNSDKRPTVTHQAIDS